MAKKQERASLHSILSLLSKKREKRRWYKSNRSPKSHDCRRKGGPTEGGRESGPIASPSSSSSFRRSLRRSKVIIEGETRHEGGLAHTRAQSRQRDWKEARDGRARYLPEQKPIDRSFDRLFYLRAATFLFSDIRITIFRAGHFPRATSHEHEGWLGYCSSFVWEFLLTFFLA